MCFVQITRLKAHKAKLLKWEFLLGPRIFCSGSMLELIFLLMIEINVCIVTKYGTFKCISSCGKRLKSENDVQVCPLFFSFPWIYSSSNSKTKVHCIGWSANVSLRKKHQTDFFPTEYSAIHVEKIQLLLYWSDTQTVLSVL